MYVMIDVLMNLMKAIADHQKLTIDVQELLNSSLNQMMVDVLVEELKATDEQQKLKVDVLELSKLWQK
jgi:hypothetical protein